MIRVVDMLGRIALEMPVEEGATFATVPTAGLAAGPYLVNVDGRSSATRLLVVH